MRAGGARLQRWRIAAAALLGWVGLVLHNVADLPGRSVLSPESSVPLAVTLALLAVLASRFRRFATVALLCWGLLNLVGGGVLSVLPLPFLPFVPEQSLGHYAMHGVYALTQVPLVVLTARSLVADRRRAGRGERSG